MKQTYVNHLKDYLGQPNVLKSWQLIVFLVIVGVLCTFGCVSNKTSELKIEQSHLIPKTATPVSVLQLTENEKEPEIELQMPILKKIATFKKENPRATTQELANKGNELLPTLGFEFDIDLGKQVEKELASTKVVTIKKEGDSGEYFYLNLPLQSENGSRKSVKLLAPAYESCCCGFTYVPVPVTQTSSTKMTVIIDGNPTVVKRTKDIPMVQEYILYTNEKKPKRIRSWEAPFETSPYGISVDGTSVYFETDIEEVVLEVSEKGVLRFAAKESSEIIT